MELLLSYVDQHEVPQVLQILEGDEGGEGTRRVPGFILLREDAVQASPDMCVCFFFVFFLLQQPFIYFLLHR